MSLYKYIYSKSNIYSSGIVSLNFFGSCVKLYFTASLCLSQVLADNWTFEMI